MTARQDDALQALLGLDKGIVDVAGMDFAVHAGFAHAARDELSDL